MKREAWDHPKFKLVGRDLKLKMFAVRGLLESIWLITGINFPHGLIRWSAEEIAVAIDYEGDPEEMIDCLVKRRLLEPLDGGWYVHDWEDHADSHICSALLKKTQLFANGAVPKMNHDSFNASTRERIKAEYAAKFPDLPLESPGQNENGPGQNPEKSGTSPGEVRAIARSQSQGRPIDTNGGAGPTLDEVRLEANLIGMPEREADSFFAYYGALGWCLGNTPIRSWRLLMPKWKTTAASRSKPRGPTKTPMKDPAQMAIDELHKLQNQQHAS